MSIEGLAQSTDKYINKRKIWYTNKSIEERRNELKTYVLKSGYLEKIRGARQQVKKALYGISEERLIDDRLLERIDNNLLDMMKIREQETELMNERGDFFYKRGVGRIGWLLQKEEHREDLAEKDKQLLHLIRSYNTQKGRLRKNLNIGTLYHSINALREAILDIPELLYKILMYDKEKKIYEVTGTYENLLKAGVIVSTGKGKKQTLSYGNRQLSDKMKKQLASVKLIRGITNNSQLREVNQVLRIENENEREKRINDIQEGLREIQRKTPLARLFDILFSYINLKRKTTSLNMGLLFEAYYHYQANRDKNRGVEHALLLIKSIQESVNNQDWLTGGDVILKGIEYQIKFSGGNTTSLKQVERFAEEILYLSAFYETASSLEDLTSSKYDGQIEELLKTITLEDIGEETSFGKSIEASVKELVKF